MEWLILPVLVLWFYHVFILISYVHEIIISSHQSSRQRGRHGRRLKGTSLCRVALFEIRVQRLGNPPRVNPPKSVVENLPNWVSDFQMVSFGFQRFPTISYFDIKTEHYILVFHMHYLCVYYLQLEMEQLPSFNTHCHLFKKGEVFKFLTVSSIIKTSSEMMMAEQP